jgi:ATP phosphoribosyltransferase regulatory subunit HisZ
MPPRRPYSELAALYTQKAEHARQRDIIAKDSALRAAITARDALADAAQEPKEELHVSAAITSLQAFIDGRLAP